MLQLPSNTPDYLSLLGATPACLQCQLPLAAVDAVEAKRHSSGNLGSGNRLAAEGLSIVDDQPCLVFGIVMDIHDQVASILLAFPCT